MEEELISIENQIKKLNTTFNKFNNALESNFQNLEFGFRESYVANYSDISSRLNNIEMMLYQKLNNNEEDNITTIR